MGQVKNLNITGTSRNCMNGVMNNPRFGDVTVIRNGISVVVPQNKLDENGCIPKGIIELISRRLGFHDAIVLNKIQGVEINKANELNLGGNY